MADPGSKPPPRRHGIADHALGALFDHVHGPGDDHDHDHDGMDALLAPGGADDVVLTSIGIDIGSSGTQIALARLRLERSDSPAANAPTSDPTTPVPASIRRVPQRRQTLHQSPVFLTPFIDGNRIDDERLEDILAQTFAAAGIDPDAIDCGVVILTGAARERDNAAAIAERLSQVCGDIVSASAGHHLEARLAAHGSGAVERSREFAQRFLNIDIGGATTKLAICESGRVVATAALAIGGRLVATDTDNRIERLEPSGAMHAARAGFAWTAGGPAPWSERKAVGAAMADQLVAVLTSNASLAHVTPLSLTGPLPPLQAIDGVIVSGGVGEYVYGRETRSFGDLGLALGRALAARIDQGTLPWPLLPAAECIRATVLGAASCSVQLSGRTGCITNPANLLPRRNLPVVRPRLELSTIAETPAVTAAIEQAFSAGDFGPDGMAAAGATTDLVLALPWQGEPEHARLAALAEGVKRGFTARSAAGKPLYIIVDADIAASLGALLANEQPVGVDVLVLDGITLDDLDYVDLGRLRLPSETVPVTIKTLVFRDEQPQTIGQKRARRPRPPARD